MGGHKGSTIYKSGSYDLRPRHAVRSPNQNKVGPWLDRGRARVEPELGRARAGLRLDWTSTVIEAKEVNTGRCYSVSYINRRSYTPTPLLSLT